VRSSSFAFAFALRSLNATIKDSDPRERGTRHCIALDWIEISLYDCAGCCHAWLHFSLSFLTKESAASLRDMQVRMATGRIRIGGVFGHPKPKPELKTRTRPELQFG
jgi:hypothetical protein